MRVPSVCTRERASLTCLPTLTLPVHTTDDTLSQCTPFVCVHAQFNGVVAGVRISMCKKLDTLHCIYYNFGPQRNNFDIPEIKGEIPT